MPVALVPNHQKEALLRQIAEHCADLTETELLIVLMDIQKLARIPKCAQPVELAPVPSRSPA